MKTLFQSLFQKIASVLHARLELKACHAFIYIYAE
jgi:hypothetical protein